MSLIVTGMGGNLGGGGGRAPLPDLEDGGHNIECPPRFWGCMIIHWNEDPFVMRAADQRCGFFFFFFFLLVREVGDVQWVPLLCVWKIDQKILRSEKKKVSESPHPRSSAFSGLARISRLAADRWKKKVCPPMIRFGFAPMVTGM